MVFLCGTSQNKRVDSLDGMDGVLHKIYRLCLDLGNLMASVRHKANHFGEGGRILSKQLSQQWSVAMSVSVQMM